MTVDLSLMKAIQGLQVKRTTKYSDYTFESIEQRLFRLKGNIVKEADMLNKSDEYWARCAASTIDQDREYHGCIHEQDRANTRV